MKNAHVLILLAGIVTFLAGLAHLFGYKFVIPILLSSNLAPKITEALKAVWLIYSAHCILLSVVIVWLSRIPGTRSVLLFLALFLVSDAMFMLRFVGPFLGLYMVSTAAVLLLVGAWLLPRRADPTHG
jgi:hypothetical protein